MFGPKASPWQTVSLTKRMVLELGLSKTTRMGPSVEPGITCFQSVMAPVSIFFKVGKASSVSLLFR